MDTDALIRSWNLLYTPDTHPTFWEGIQDLAAQNLLKIPVQVLHELERQRDGLYEWCRDRKDVLCFEPTGNTEQVHRSLVNDYPSLAGSLAEIGSNYADLYLVAVSSIHDAAVVTFENFHPQKAPRNYQLTNVCHDEGVEFIRVYELIGREGWVFKHI